MEEYVLITGGSDRIGKAIAIELARQGYNLILHYNQSKKKAEQVKKDIIKRYSVDVKTVGINFLEEYDFNAFFSQFKSEGYIINLLINSASDFQRSTFTDKGKELLNKQMKINFETPYLLTKAFASIYDEGQVINFLDTKITKHSTDRLDYILSKKTLHEFTLLAAFELAPHFKVNAIAPGIVLPPPGENEEYLVSLSSSIPMQKIGSVNDVIKAFRYLLDAEFVTGQVLYIDGGDHLI